MVELTKLASFSNEIQVTRTFDAEWKRHFILIVECGVLFFIMPIALYWFRHILAFNVITVLLLLALASMIYMCTDKQFDHSILWNTRDFSFHMKQIGTAFIFISILLSLFTYFFYTERFFVFPINRENAWIVFMLIYPLLSALPQEIIFKCFFFHRYRSVFQGQMSLIFLNGLSFGLFHLWYDNIIAPLFSMIAGMILAYRYLKTKSLIIITIEHSILGIFLYFVGLGWFFYSGSIR